MKPKNYMEVKDYGQLAHLEIVYDVLDGTETDKLVKVCGYNFIWDEERHPLYPVSVFFTALCANLRNGDK